MKLIQLGSFYRPNDHSPKWRGNQHNGEMTGNYKPERLLVSSMYKELTKLNSNEWSSQEMGKGQKQECSREWNTRNDRTWDTQSHWASGKYSERWFTSSQLEWPPSKKQAKTGNDGDSVGKQALGRNVNSYNHYQRQFKVYSGIRKYVYHTVQHLTPVNTPSKIKWKCELSPTPMFIASSSDCNK